jgi:surfeit locus 1 family protein
MLCLTLLVVAVFARLGTWQLSRAQEKIDMQAAADSANEQPLLQELQAIDNSVLYRRVLLSGRYDFSRQFLRDNRLHNRQPGYEVLTPFYPDNDTSRAILVNRGWLPQGTNRADTPDVAAGAYATPDSVTGLIVTPSKGFTLGEAVDPGATDWPLVIQYIDYETISNKLDKIAVMPAVIVLAPGQSEGYTRIWQPVANGPVKHYGYAFQWFAMMLAVIVLFIYLNFLKKK